MRIELRVRAWQRVYVNRTQHTRVQESDNVKKIYNERCGRNETTVIGILDDDLR